MKKLLSLTMVVLLSACSTANTNLNVEKKADIQKTNVVSTLKEASITQLKQDNVQNVVLADMGAKDGASFKIDVKVADGFKTKANVSGIVEKKLTDIANVDVYLLSLAAAPTAGSNPLGVANANVVKSFAGVVKTDTGTGFTLLFKGVPGLATNQYFVGIVLKDSTSTVINKAPATPWTLDTLATSPSLAVSSSGVGVNTTTLAVSTTVALTVSTTLLDAVGAQIDTTATSTAGVNTLTNAAVTIQ